jgi:hypothetical protein
VVNGSHEDLDTIQSLAAQADIVVNAADADDLPLTKAILAGLKARSKSVSFKPILIHTSGSGVISDQAEGEFLPSGQKIWNVRFIVFHDFHINETHSAITRTTRRMIFAASHLKSLIA